MSLGLLTSRTLPVVVQARLGGTNGLVLAEQKIDAFDLDYSPVTHIVVNGATDIANTYMTMKPWIPNIDVNCEMYAHFSTFADGSTAYELNTSDFGGKNVNGDPSVELVVDPTTGETQAVLRVDFGMPPEEDGYCFRASFDQHSKYGTEVECKHINGTKCDFTPVPLYICEGDLSPHTLVVNERPVTGGNLTHDPGDPTATPPVPPHQHTMTPFKLVPPPPPPAVAVDDGLKFEIVPPSDKYNCLAASQWNASVKLKAAAVAGDKLSADICGTKFPDVITVLKVEIDGYVNGEGGRKIDNCVERSSNASTDDDVRTITAGHVKCEADITPTGLTGLGYEWTFSGGTPDAANTAQTINWNAPTTENDVTVTLKVKDSGGNVICTKTATIKPVKPRVIRLKFVDDDAGNIITLKDEGQNAAIVAPQYDRTDTSWETGHEAYNDPFKNESAAYVKGGNLRVVGDGAATDLPNTIGGNPHTATQHKDLSAATPMKLSVADTTPALTFKNKDSGAAVGSDFDVQDWSVLDYGDKTTFTSDQQLGETGPKIRFYFESTLNWTIYVKDKAGSWVNALGGATTWDTTHHSLCVANAKPIAPPYPGHGVGANTAWEKVMQYSCDWAKTKGGADAAAKKDIVEALWAGIDVADTSGTGARHDINYTFVNNTTTVRDFCNHGCHGSCGVQAFFFCEIGAAQAVGIDMVHMEMINPTPVGESTDIGVGVPDVDGDWREPTFSDLTDGLPLVGGQEAWWFNPPVDLANPGEHASCQYDSGAGTTVYDASFGEKRDGSWPDYMKSAVAYWRIKTGAGAGVWETWAQVINNCHVIRWKQYKNFAYQGTVAWGVHHFKVDVASPQTAGAAFNVTVTAG